MTRPVSISEHLGRARTLAMREGHARIIAAHLLASLSSVPTIQRHITASGYSLARLDRWIRNALIAEPTGRHARAEPWVDGSVESLLAGNVTEAALFARLVAPISEDLRFDETPLRRFADAVVSATHASGHERALVEHALYALARRATDEGHFASALSRLGHARRDFRHAMAQRIAAIAHSGSVATYEELRFRTIYHANTRLKDNLDLQAIVVDLLRSPQTRQALESASVPPAALLFSYVHGGIPPLLPLTSGPAEVVFYTDDFTPPETLADLLVRRFGHSPEAAASLVLAVHTEGQRAIRVAEGRVVVDAVKRTLAECAELGMPLRIEVRAIPVGGGLLGGFDDDESWP